MKSGLIPQKAPGLLCKLIDADHAYAVNCSYPNSFRVLNKAQFNILNSVNGTDSLREIAGRLEIQEAVLERFFTLLSKTELVRFDNGFGVPQRPEKPQSLNFWIHTTNACNLGCNYCYISTLNTGKGMMAIVRNQLIYKLVEAATKHNIKNIKLRLAGGEPLSQFSSWKAFIPEAFQALAQVGCKLDIAFITNLTLLNAEIISFAKQYKVSFGVSLDGIAEVHDATRQFRSGSGTFEIVDSNLRTLIAEDIAVSVNTVVNNFNLIGLPELTKYLIDLDIPFRYSIVKGEAIHGELLEENLLASYAIMQEAITEGWQFSKRYQFCDLKPNDLGFQTCASGFSGGAIYVDGSFKYCHVQFGKEANAETSIFSAGLDLVEMIESGEHLEDKKSEDCKQCRYRSVCTSGCPVYRIKDKDPQCSLYHRFIPKYYELQAIERLQLLQKCVIMPS
ncbi:radical SAM/SPASM domain-containing protein [Mucilaginibacter pedocola]|uniref:Radical SAM/SPASM domain-containing protein n=1 Tax=Mucilaginibacter pedocola TaxID=1792845 RepID=A0A1S9P947_9SPHI|nr:radical SAM protein [Mucilaginibacter pedocola]OOQ57357.1 radical SAM/SPASM domain-containing protein [Mucilaginibacter pedocola]